MNPPQTVMELTTGANQEPEKDSDVSIRIRDARTPQLLEETLAYARERDYVGWDYFDGMSSRLLTTLPVENKWLNIAVQETVKRAPINVRPYFLVEQRRNFKGTALFVMANATAFELTGDDGYAEEVIELADWLISEQSDRVEGFCGGHRHPMQQLRERRPANTPNIVTTSFAVRALLRAAAFDSGYAETARSVETFLDDALEYRESAHGATINYHPDEPDNFETINGTAMAARLYADLYAAFGDDRYRERSGKLLDHVVAHQTDLGGWTYRIPSSASHLSMDNHHNGFIVESLLRYQQVTGDDRHADALEQSLSFYRYRLFDADGAPRWDESQTYPRDIHAASQGIITFAAAGDDDFARSILEWTLTQLYAGSGRFWYQQRRWYTKRFTLMRWCQAWMAYAMVHLLEGVPQLPRDLTADGGDSDESP